MCEDERINVSSSSSFNEDWILKILFYGVMGLVIGIPIYLGHLRDLRRIDRDPHVQAEILDIWVYKSAKTGRLTDDVGGRIKFKRTAKGKVVDCEIERPLGKTNLNLKIGDFIEIVPRLDSCYEPVIMNRMH